MLAGDVAEDGVGLGDLDVAVEVVGQIGEVEAEGALDAGPGAAVKVRGRTARHELVLEGSLGVLQEEADRLGQLEQHSIDWRIFHLGLYVWRTIKGESSSSGFC